jgi:hypothetical protein
MLQKVMRGDEEKMILLLVYAPGARSTRFQAAMLLSTLSFILILCCFRSASETSPQVQGFYMRIFGCTPPTGQTSPHPAHPP